MTEYFVPGATPAFLQSSADGGTPWTDAAGNQHAGNALALWSPAERRQAGAVVRPDCAAGETVDRGPDGWLTRPLGPAERDDALAQAARRAVARCKAAFHARLAAGLPLGDGQRLQIDAEAQRHLAAARAMAAERRGRWADATATWVLADNREAVLTPAEFVAIADAAVLHVDALFEALKSHRRAVVALANEAERSLAECLMALDAYDGAAGWP